MVVWLSCPLQLIFTKINISEIQTTHLLINLENVNYLAMSATMYGHYTYMQYFGEIKNELFIILVI